MALGSKTFVHVLTTTNSWPPASAVPDAGFAPLSTVPGVDPC
jgi:hypothetical protein